MTATYTFQSVGSGQPAAGYWLEVMCPDCGCRRLEHVAAGTAGMDTQAIARCPGCNRHWAFVIRMADVTADLGARVRQPNQSQPKVRRDRGGHAA